MAPAARHARLLATRCVSCSVLVKHNQGLRRNLSRTLGRPYLCGGQDNNLRVAERIANNRASPAMKTRSRARHDELNGLPPLWLHRGVRSAPHDHDSGGGKREQCQHGDSPCRDCGNAVVNLRTRLSHMVFDRMR